MGTSEIRGVHLSFMCPTQHREDAARAGQEHTGMAGCTWPGGCTRGWLSVPAGAPAAAVTRAIATHRHVISCVCFCQAILQRFYKRTKHGAKNGARINTPPLTRPFKAPPFNTHLAPFNTPSFHTHPFRGTRNYERAFSMSKCVEKKSIRYR